MRQLSDIFSKFAHNATYYVFKISNFQSIEMLRGFTMPSSRMARLVNTCMASNCFTKYPCSLARTCSNFGYWDPAQFKPKKAVILTKVATLVLKA